MKCTVSHYIAICLFGSENYIILFLPWFLIKISFDVINFGKYTGIQNLSNDGGYLGGGHNSTRNHLGYMKFRIQRQNFIFFKMKKTMQKWIEHTQHRIKQKKNGFLKE